MSQYILSFDQGTTSSRAIIFNKKGEIVAVAQKEFTQIFPEPGLVEHDANEIWSTQLGVAAEVISKANLSVKDIAAIGITNQRETTVVWDRITGQPIHNAIVWQDRRTASFCDELRAKGEHIKIQEKTGLILDAYFSATKVKWILDHTPGAREKAAKGELCFGTVDSWLVYKLTNGQVHVTDVSNASRTMLFNIHSLEWDADLLGLFNVPASMLPSVKSSSEIYGHTQNILNAHNIPIAGIAGDQQAALFGQMCTQPGMVKNTYGTGCFMLMNTGQKAVPSTNQLLTTIAWQINGVTSYALEGSVFIAGAVVQWLRDGLRAFDQSADVQALAASVPDAGGVVLVPAFTGLGAPYWQADARGTMTGLSRGTTMAHIARAALESIAFQSTALLHAMNRDAAQSVTELRVDGGACVNDLLMQFQADLLGIPVLRPVVIETTALGAAYLAGLGAGIYQSPQQLSSRWRVERAFEPLMSRDQAGARMAAWDKAVRQTVAA